MTVFRKIKISFWQDRYILQLSPNETYFYIYLLTNSQTKQCGIYEIPIEVMKMEAKLKEEEIYKHLSKFQIDGKIEFNKENSEIMIRNWVKHNYSKSNKIIKCVEDELKSVKTKEFIKHYHTLCKEYGCSIDTLSKEEEEKEEKEEKEKKYADEESDIQSDNNNFKKTVKPEEPKKDLFNPVKEHARRCFEEKGPDCRLKSTSRGLEEKCYVCLNERKNWKKGEAI
jgi:hypothetical protein